MSKCTNFDQVKVLEQCQISPPPYSVPTTALPLTFLDVPWLICCPVQRIFLYQVPFSPAQFTEEILPMFKNSLSLALRLFFPFCGSLVCPPRLSEPYILYKDTDYVTFLVAQSNGAFSEFLIDRPKDAKDCHQLVPPTPPPTRTLDDETLMELTPILAVQITLFPNSGLAIGIKFNHIVADGMSFNHFVKTWASIFKAKCDLASAAITMPNHDRGVIKDSHGIKSALLDRWRAWKCQTGKATTDNMEDKLRVTLSLSRVEIDRLKKWVSTKCDNGMKTDINFHFSSYVVTCAFIWVCLIKSLDVLNPDDSTELCHFVIVADCRHKSELGIPVTYFGNCLSAQLVSVARSKFREEECLSAAAVALSEGVQSLKHGTLDGLEYAFSKWAEASERGEDLTTVAGSPKLAAYETDFGWGIPAKTEVVHIDVSGSISLNESRNEKGGIEIGICRSKHQMEVFTSIFNKGKSQFL